MSSSVVFQRLLLDLWAGIRGVPVSLSRRATKLKQCDENPIFLPLMATIQYVPRYPYFVTG